MVLVDFCPSWHGVLENGKDVLAWAYHCGHEGGAEGTSDRSRRADFCEADARAAARAAPEVGQGDVERGI